MAAPKSVLIAFVLVVVAFALQLIGVSTPYWNSTESNSITINSGLFYLCAKTDGSSTCQELGFDTYWLNIVQVLELTGVVLLLISIIFILCNHFICAGNTVLYAIIAAVLSTTGLLILVGTIIYGAQVEKQLHFSFAFCVIAALVTAAAAIILLHKSSCCDKINENKREHSTITNQSSIYGRRNIFTTNESTSTQSAHSLRKTRKVSPQMEGIITTDRATSVSDLLDHSRKTFDYDNRKKFTTYKCVCLCCFRNKHDDYVLDKSKLGITRVRNDDTYSTRRHTVSDKEYSHYPSCGCFLQKDKEIENIENSQGDCYMHQNTNDTKLTIFNQTHEGKDKPMDENVYMEKNKDSDLSDKHSTNSTKAPKNNQQEANRTSKENYMDTLAVRKQNAKTPRIAQENETKRMKNKSEKQPNIPTVHGGGAFKAKPETQHAIVSKEDDPKNGGKEEFILGRNYYIYDIEDENIYSSQDQIESIQGDHSLYSSVEEPSKKSEPQRKGHMYSRHSGNDVPGFQLDKPDVLSAPHGPQKEAYPAVKRHKKTVVYQDENMQLKSEQRENSLYPDDPYSIDRRDSSYQNGKVQKRASQLSEQQRKPNEEKPKRPRSDKQGNQEKKPWRSIF